MGAQDKNYSQYINPPITKIGVVVRLIGENGQADKFMMVQPKEGTRPFMHKEKKQQKQQEGPPPYVLPRGTRMYLDPITGQKHDARDAKTAKRFADHLESPLDTAARELEEEAGIPAALFFERQPVEFGAWEYASLRSYKGYPIVWYGISLQQADLIQLVPAVDSAKTAWMDIASYDALVKKGQARAGYAAVIKRAAELFA